MDKQIEWLKARIADLQLPAGKRDHATREEWLLQCGMPAVETHAPLSPMTAHNDFLEAFEDFSAENKRREAERHAPGSQERLALADSVMRLLEDHDRCPPQARDYSRRRGTLTLIMKAIERHNETRAPVSPLHEARAKGHAMGWRQALDVAIYVTADALSAMIVEGLTDLQEAHSQVIEKLTALYGVAPAPEPHVEGSRDAR